MELDDNKGLNLKMYMVPRTRICACIDGQHMLMSSVQEFTHAGGKADDGSTKTAGSPDGPENPFGAKAFDLDIFHY